MRNERSIAALLALAVMALVAADAHAMYDPHTGRFLQRDPVGTGDIVIHHQTGGPRIIVAGGVANPVFIPRDPLPVQPGIGQAGPSQQYQDGMNLYQYVRSRPISAVDPLGLQASQPSSQPQPDKSNVCCHYEKGHNYPPPGGLQPNVNGSSRYWWQNTVKPCPTGDTPQCACLRAQKTYDTRNSIGYGKWLIIRNAEWGKCCSCKVEVRRLNKPYIGYPNHVLIYVSCTDKTSWFADHPPASSGSPPPSTIQTDYTEIVESYCLSCASASALRQKADSYKGASYGLIHDCYWYVRSVLSDRTYWEHSDGCK